ncbi:MAG: hypothetical protein NTZ56_05670 [Acidobacteria bacterium]|nr:hypothetical protein [Acidobacteriota bacterium]
MTKLAPLLILAALPVAALDIVASAGLNSAGQASANSTSGALPASVTAGGRAVGLLNVGGNFFNLGAVAVGMELPVILGGAGWSQVTSRVITAESLNLAVIPGLRVRVLPISPITPWISAGVGAGRLSRALSDRSPIRPGAPSNETQGVFVWDAAAGLDFKPVSFLLFRAEIRNFRFQSPESVNFEIPRLGRNNASFLAGIGIRF